MRINLRTKEISTTPASPADQPEMPNFILNIFALMMHISASNSTEQAMLHVGAHLLPLLGSKKCKDIMTYITDSVLGTTAKPETTQVTLPNWLQDLKKYRMDWKALTHSETKFKLEQLFGILVAIGLCDVAQVSFDLGRFKLFRPRSVDDHDVFTLMDLVLEIVVYFIETGYCAWYLGSPKVLITGAANYDMDVEFNNVIRRWELYKRGNLKRLEGIDNADFRLSVETLYCNLERACRYTTSTFERNVHARRKSSIGAIMSELNSAKMSGRPKVKPFMLELFGESGQGKTPLMDVIIGACLASRGLSTDPSHTYSRDSTQKFWDGCTTNKIAVKLDDPTFSKEMKDNHFAEDLCLIGGNELRAVNMSDVADKGCITPEFKIAVVSTNAKNLRATEVAYDPWAMQRRFNYCMSIEVKPEFAVPGPDGMAQLDDIAVSEHYGDSVRPQVEDLWNVRLERPKRHSRKNYNCEYDAVEIKGKKVYSMPVAIDFLTQEFNAFMDNQEQFVQMKQETTNAMVQCPHEGCRRLAYLCTEHGDVKPSLPIEPGGSRHWLNCLPDLRVPSFCFTKLPISLPSSEVSKCDPPNDQPVCDSCPPMGDPPEISQPESLRGAVETIAALGASSMFSRVATFEERVCEAAVVQARWFFFWFDWMQYVPSWFLEYDWFVRGMIWIDRWNSFKAISRSIFITHLFFVFFTITPCYFMGFGLKHSIIYGELIASPFMLCWYKWFIERGIQSYVAQLQHRNICGFLEQEKRDQIVGDTIKACAAIGAIYAFCKMGIVAKELTSLYNSTFGEYLPKIPGAPAKESKEVDECEDQPARGEILILPSSDMSTITSGVDVAQIQGSFEPETEEEVALRDRGHNDWIKVVKRSLPCGLKSINITHEDLSRKVAGQSRYIQLVPKKGEPPEMARALLVDSETAVLPAHYFATSEAYEVTFFRDQPHSSAGKFASRISLQNSVLVPGTDLAVVALDSGGPFECLLDYMTDDDFAETPFSFIRPMKNGEVDCLKGRGFSTKCTHELAKDFNGIAYTYLSAATAPGFCGSVLVSENKAPTIMGIHVAGAARSTGFHGIAAPLKRSQIATAMDELDRRIPGRIRAARPESVHLRIGKDPIVRSEPHPKSPLNYMPKNSQIVYLGSTNMNIRLKSHVKPTPIAQTVEQVFQCENRCVGPVIHPKWFGLQKTVEAMAVPGLPHDHALMAKAILDYLSSAKAVFVKPIWSNCRPLTDQENINGIPGKKFIDSLKLGTSAYPYKGIKRDHVTGEDGERELSPEIMEEINEVEKLFEERTRAYLAAKACMKDEVLEKEKCRYFFASHLILTFLVRKYFLPLIRVIQMNPFVFECAVGMNAHGPDWQHLHDHMLKFGKERIIAGDYSQYDTRIPAQCLRGALWILIQCAKLCEYTERDITVMESIATELLYPIINLNGDIVMTQEGTHISGNSLTVILNGIVGSLNMRCFFFKLFPDTPFKEAVALITYGDDNAGSVKEGFEDFNAKSFSEYLEPLGQIYTNPDKSSDLKEFLPYDELEFLKRKSVYHESLGCCVGALAHTSIWKSLLAHVYDPKRTLETEKEVTGQAMASAAIEMFNHGKEFYDEHIAKLREVAETHEMAHMVVGLDLTYEQRAEAWKEKYQPEPNAAPSAA